MRLGSDPAAPRLLADGLRLAPDGDATIVRPPETWRIAGDGPTSAEVTAEDLEIRVTGAIDAPSYAVVDPDLAVEAVVTGSEGAEAPVDVTLRAEALDMRVAPDRHVELSAGRLAATATPRAPDQGRLAFSYDDFGLALDGPISAAVAPLGDAPQPFNLTTRAASSRLAVTAPMEEGGAPVTATLSSGPVESAVESADGRLDIAQTASAIVATATGEPVPLPDARVEIAALTLRLSVPAVPVDRPAPLSVDLGVTGLAPSEQIWQLLDPGAALPRAPGELRLSASGQLSWQTDADPAVPALERLSLDTLRLSALGAEVTGQGGVQFTPPATPETPGMPLGSLVFTLDGVLGLIDRLAQLGTIPPGELMGAQLALGLFTEAGEGDDTLTSRVEFAPDGAIVVNGTPIGSLR